MFVKIIFRTKLDLFWTTAIILYLGCCLLEKLRRRQNCGTFY